SRRSKYAQLTGRCEGEKSAFFLMQRRNLRSYPPLAAQKYGNNLPVRMTERPLLAGQRRLLASFNFPRSLPLTNWCSRTQSGRLNVRGERRAKRVRSSAGLDGPVMATSFKQFDEGLLQYLPNRGL